MSTEPRRGSALDDPERLALLDASGLLDAERVEIFDRLACAAGHALHAPVAQVNLLTENRQIPRACYGPEPWKSGGPVELDYSYCQHIISSAEPLIVPDTREHPLTRHSRATTESGIVAYAGVPLTVGEHTLGSLCVVDFEPREWTAEEVTLLRALADVATTDLEDRVRANRRMRDALRESENRYRALAEVDPDAILEIDELSIILSANPAVERIFGYTPEELVGEPLSILIPERLRGEHQAGMARYLATGERNIPWEGIELPAITKSGREIVTEVSFGEYTLEGRHVFAGFIRDVSERKHVELFRALEHRITRALSESHTLEVAAPRVLREMGESLGWSVGVLWVLDAHDQVLRCVGVWSDAATRAPTFEARTRRTPFARGVGLPGRIWEELTPLWIVDVQAQPDFPRALRAAEEGLHSAFGFPVRSGDDFLGVIEFFSPRIQEPDEELLRMVDAIGADVAESIRRVEAEEERDRARAELARLNADLKKANERLKERTAEAEAASQAKSDFMATMSHELRTPLNAVIGYSDLLQMGVPEPIPASALRPVRQIGLSARHLLELIDDILTFARVESGRETVRNTRVRLGDLLQGVEAIIEPAARAKGLELRVAPGDPDLVVRTDAGKVRQILLQLLNNAVKFTARGHVELGTAVEDGWLVYSVRDTGMGIPPEHQAKIFDPFWQVEQTITRSAEGTGMGLTVSDRLARLMGGEVRLQSTPGEGSVFMLRLPLKE